MNLVAQFGADRDLSCSQRALDANACSLMALAAEELVRSAVEILAALRDLGAARSWRLLRYFAFFSAASKSEQAEVRLLSSFASSEFANETCSLVCWFAASR